MHVIANVLGLSHVLQMVDDVPQGLKHETQTCFPVTPSRSCRSSVEMVPCIAKGKASRSGGRRRILLHRPFRRWLSTHIEAEDRSSQSLSIQGIEEVVPGPIVRAPEAVLKCGPVKKQLDDGPSVATGIGKCSVWIDGGPWHSEVGQFPTRLEK